MDNCSRYIFGATIVFSLCFSISINIIHSVMLKDLSEQVSLLKMNVKLSCGSDPRINDKNEMTDTEIRSYVDQEVTKNDATNETEDPELEHEFEQKIYHRVHQQFQRLTEQLYKNISETSNFANYNVANDTSSFNSNSKIPKPSHFRNFNHIKHDMLETKIKRLEARVEKLNKVISNRAIIERETIITEQLRDSDSEKIENIQTRLDFLNATISDQLLDLYTELVGLSLELEEHAALKRHKQINRGSGKCS